MSSAQATAMLTWPLLWTPTTTTLSTRIKAAPSSRWPHRPSRAAAGGALLSFHLRRSTRRPNATSPARATRLLSAWWTTMATAFLTSTSATRSSSRLSSTRIVARVDSASVGAMSSTATMAMVRCELRSWHTQLCQLHVVAIAPPIPARLAHASCLRTGTFTDVWEDAFSGQKAPVPTPEANPTVAGTYRNGLNALWALAGTGANTEQVFYKPAVHGYPGISADRQTLGIAWGDYGTRLALPHP